MQISREEFRPDPEASREAMEAQQRAIAEAASFEDRFDFDPDAIQIADPLSLDDRVSPVESEPIVAGIDQAFEAESAVSAVVAVQADEVVACSCARTPLSIPYIPGLLAFREGGPIVAALDSLSVEPDLLFFDGSGRIHYRQAGIATHVGVIFDIPAIGVTKNLLCGSPTSSLADPLPQGTHVPIEADSEVETDPGTVIGYAFQSRQFPDPETRHVNPVFVSPGHRVSAETAVELTEHVCAGYKLPEPIRLADRAADAEKT